MQRAADRADQSVLFFEGSAKFEDHAWIGIGTALSCHVPKLTVKVTSIITVGWGT